jgi:hypothetical protein
MDVGLIEEGPDKVHLFNDEVLQDLSVLKVTQAPTALPNEDPTFPVHYNLIVGTREPTGHVQVNLHLLSSRDGDGILDTGEKAKE